MLHLFNRAHINAKGGEKECLESDLNDTEDEDFVIETHAESISELIHYVQNEAKKLRHGIEYTKMLESTLGCFKRPKV